MQRMLRVMRCRYQKKETCCSFWKKEKKGTQPAKYFADAETKPSKHTKKFKHCMVRVMHLNK